MKKFFREFKDFIAKGNVIDMAVAVVIGGAFKEIVNALVNDIIMPFIGMMTGGASMSDWKYVITPEKLAADGTVLEAENALMYGDLIQKIVDFLIIALCIFVALKVVLALQTKTRELAHKKDPKKTDITDLRRKGKKGEIRSHIRYVQVCFFW